MDTIRFISMPVMENPNREMRNLYGGLRILINGVDFVSLVREYELAAGVEDDLAGDYVGLEPEYGLRIFAGDTHCGYQEDGFVSIMGCAFCGTSPCRPFFCLITFNTNTVVISHFHEPHFGPDQGYNGLGPFVFDLDQYIDALMHPFEVIYN